MSSVKAVPVSCLWPGCWPDYHVCAQGGGEAAEPGPWEELLLRPGGRLQVGVQGGCGEVQGG